MKLVTSTKINIDEPMDLYTVVTDGKLDIGLDVQQKGTNWIGLDNVYLYYWGKDWAACEALVEEILKTEPDYESLFAEEEAYCQKSVYEDYLAAKQNLQGLLAEKSGEPNVEAIARALSAFNAASKTLAESVNAYSAYQAKYAEADDFLSATTSESDEVNLLSDYMIDDSAAEGRFNGNGGAVYILANGLLDNTQIAAEAAYLDKLLKDAMANAMSDGDDCTSLLVNPNFAEQGGWKSAVGPTWPEGNIEVFPVMQAANMVCDVYQELTGLQNGLYEFNIQAAFRPGGEYTDENEQVAQAYAYINSFEVKVPSGSEDNINEAGEASAAFAEGKYPVTVYGLVTDGTMKLGVTNKVRSVESCRLWAGGAKLIFRAKNEEALAVATQRTMPTAQALQGNYAGNPELDELANAIAEAEAADDGYVALIALKKAMEDVQTGTSLYADLAVALKSLSEAIETATTASAITLKNAQAQLDEAQAAYDSKSYNNAEAEQAISDLNAAKVSIKMGGDIASEDNPIDYSSMIVNANFDPTRGSKNDGVIEGWTTTAMNGYKEFTVSYNRAPFELSQKLSGLPKGKYKVTVHTYYRAGYWNEEEQYMANGTETHLTTLYAQTSADQFSIPCLNLTEGATTETYGEGKYYTLSSGLFAPDGTSPTAAWFAAGAYLNELTFSVPEDGEVTLGLSKKEVLANDYQVVGEWKLYYMGDPDASKADTIDVTDLIVNPTFDPARGSKNDGVIEGWTTTAMNGYKEYTASYNRAPFELYQDLSGLPAGKYMATVHTYYRAGYWNEEEQYMANGTETHLTTLYAETSEDKFTVPCLNLTEGATAETYAEKYYTLSSGLFAPDGTSPTAAWFAAGAYLNKIEFVVGEDGKARIGLSKKEVLANDYQVVGEWKLYYLGCDKPEITEIDVTDLIVNPTFDPARGSKNDGVIEGWTTTAMNGYKEYTVSYNRAPFELNQKLSGLREGDYRMTVHTYYRAGYWNEEEQYMANGTETHLTTLYAETADKTYSKPCLNLTEGATAETYAEKFYTLSSGLFAPDGTSPTAAWFAAGAYLNELKFHVGADGNVTIGLSKKEVLANDYQVVGEWKLYYLGNNGSETEVITLNDITELIDAYLTNGEGADYDGDGSFTVGDITALIEKYLAQ